MYMYIFWIIVTILCFFFFSFLVPDEEDPDTISQMVGL